MLLNWGKRVMTAQTLDEVFNDVDWIFCIQDRHGVWSREDGDTARSLPRILIQ